MKYSFKEINTLANYISFLRVLLAIPIFILLDYVNTSYHYRLVLASIMLLAVVTDLLDGYVARKNNQVTEIGKIVDPFADKLCIGIIVVKLFLIGEIPGYLFWTVILRDVIIFLGGIYVSRKINKVLPSNRLGKITAFMIGIYMMSTVLGSAAYPFYHNLLIYLVIGLSIASLIGYAIRGFETIRYYRDGTL